MGFLLRGLAPTPLRGYPPDFVRVHVSRLRHCTCGCSLRDCMHPPPFGVRSCVPHSFTQGSALRRSAATCWRCRDFFFPTFVSKKMWGSLRALYAGGAARLRCHLAGSIIWQLRGYFPPHPPRSPHPFGPAFESSPRCAAGMSQALFGVGSSWSYLNPKSPSVPGRATSHPPLNRYSYLLVVTPLFPRRPFTVRSGAGRTPRAQRPTPGPPVSVPMALSVMVTTCK